VQGWSAAQVHDTVAAIMQQRGYQRSIQSSLLQRLFRRVRDLLDEWFRSLSALPHAKWIVIAAAIVVALLIIARIAYSARLRDVERARRAVRGERTVPSDPWAEAERLAATGAYLDAAHALYRGLLESLAQRDSLRLHPSKTTGDYVRELRSRGSASHSGFRQFARRYDRVLFGDHACDATTYAALRDDALRLASTNRAA
jgi:hypothetical protein